MVWIRNTPLWTPLWDTTVSIVYINTEVNDRYAVLPQICLRLRGPISRRFHRSSDIVFVTGHMMLGQFDYECADFFKEWKEKAPTVLMLVGSAGEMDGKIEKVLPYRPVYAKQ